MSIYTSNSWRPEKGVRIPGASIKAAVSYMTQTIVLGSPRALLTNKLPSSIP